MQVQPQRPSVNAIVKNFPDQQSGELKSGQRLDIQLAKPVAAGSTVSVNIGGQVFELRSAAALQAGQVVQVQLTFEEGKLALKLIQQADNPKLTSSAASVATDKQLSLIDNLKPGQQMAVEVVKVLAKQRVLVQTLTNDLLPSANKPQQFDVDVSRLNKTQQLGEQLQMTVVSTKPLNIQLHPPSREQQIIDSIRQLLPQQTVTPQLKVLSHLVQQNSLPEGVRQAVEQLVQHTTNRSQLTDAGMMKQALLSSGLVMENKLLSQPSSQTQDFKANLAKVMTAVEASLAGMKGTEAKPELNRLPAQVTSALSANGKSPAQLLNVLLSHNYRMLTPASNSVLSTITTASQALSLAQLLTKPLMLSPQQMPKGAEIMANRPELMQLLKEAEGMHHKLQLNQLMSLKDPDTSNTTSSASWLFDVPIKDKQSLDIVQMQIEQRKHGGQEEEEDTWNVKVRLDTQNLGPVQALVTFHQENVSVMIRAEKAESAELLTENLPILEQALAELDLNMGNIDCECGEVEQAILTPQVQQQETSMVDVSV